MQSETGVINTVIYTLPMWRELQALENNPKDHDIGELVNSLVRFGYIEPIVVNKRTNTILAGHGRREALLWIMRERLPIPKGISDSWGVPVYVVDIDEQDQQAAAIALNRIQELGGWDEPKLANMLKGLAQQGEEMLKGVGFDLDDVDELLKKAGLEQLTEEQEPEVDLTAGEKLANSWGVKVGQLWQAGVHMIACGDSTDPAVVASVMGDSIASLCIADPPYNIGKEYNQDYTDTMDLGEYQKFSRGWFDNVVKYTDKIIITPGFWNIWPWMRTFDPPYHTAAWTKTNSMSRGFISRFSCYEPILFYGKHWGRTRPGDVFDFPIGSQKNVGDHPCPKPLKLFLELVSLYSEEGTIVFDPFAGAGTTLVACLRTNRICRTIDLSPAYVAICLERYHTETGNMPVLVKDKFNDKGDF